MKETGYPVSMEDVKLSAVEVEYYMNEEHNEYSSPVVYDQPEQLEELKKVLRCYQMVPFWEKREADKWARLKVVIDGVESEAALVHNGEGCSGIYERGFTAGIIL